MRAIGGTAVPPPSYKYAGIGHGHAARRPDGELIKDLLLHTPPRTWGRPAEDVGNHNQDRPGAPLRTASPRPRTMENGLVEIVNEPGVPVVNSIGAFNPPRVNATIRTSTLITYHEVCELEGHLNEGVG